MLRLLTFLTVLAYCTSFQTALKANSASRIPGSSRVPVLAQSSVTSSTPAVSNVNDEINGTGMIKRKAKVLKEPNLWEYNFGLQDHQITLPHSITPRVTPPETYLISESDIQVLERDGVVLLKNVFDEDWVRYMREATMRQTQEPHFWSFAGTASKLYDYIQRNVWQTNKAFANFYYHSAVGDVLRQMGRCDEIRVSTDLLMVNPNKGFKWHQDNQNGPIIPEEGLRFWITMDSTPADYGSPVYLTGSHKNTAVPDNDVFVDIEMSGLEEWKDRKQNFQVGPGDMLIWHPKTIHKIDGPADGIWDTYRRVLGGTVAKSNTLYHDKTGSGGVLSDLGRHGLQDGDKLSSPFFPMIYPRFDREEAKARDEGVVGRNPKDIISKLGGLAGSSAGNRFYSFFQVLGSNTKHPGT
ncbi:hypothetical protein TrLO_g1719 [Triparma laevis f. longispina]|uniref:Uncharacterized protein n=1 Tax=Triparma laevis f. longispina TaxID=1714387 RepID=A0A9W7KYT9_9STRA|nr:hypothetical protein TrLO_g1719 [Triparma laevis f. longispina]